MVCLFHLRASLFFPKNSRIQSTQCKYRDMTKHLKIVNTKR